jgi:hypothetical protein
MASVSLYSLTRAAFCALMEYRLLIPLKSAAVRFVLQRIDTELPCPMPRQIPRMRLATQVQVLISSDGSVIDLQLTREYYEIHDINDVGQLVGKWNPPGGGTHPFITGPNGMGFTHLGTLGGDYAAAVGINNTGHVVGSSGTSKTEITNVAFITGANGVGMRALGDRLGFGEGVDINNKGQAVWNEHYYLNTDTSHAFISA